MLTIKLIKPISPFHFLFERARSTICYMKTCKPLRVARSRTKPPIGLIVDMSDIFSSCLADLDWLREVQIIPDYVHPLGPSAGPRIANDVAPELVGGISGHLTSVCSL